MLLLMTVCSQPLVGFRFLYFFNKGGVGGWGEMLQICPKWGAVQLRCSVDISVNCRWVDTRWQQYSTHLHTNSTQNDTINLLKPNDVYIYIYIYIYKRRTAALTSRRYILNIYSTNIHTEYFKHAA